MAAFKSTEEFIEKLRFLGINHVTPIEEYQGNSITIKFRCSRCNGIFTNSPYKVLTRGTCTLCSRKKPKLNTESFQSKLDNVFPNNEYTILSEYKGNLEDMMFRHNSEYCGDYEFITKPNYILQGKACPICTGRKWNTARVKNEIANKYPFLEIISEIDIDSTPDTLILTKNTNCGHENYYTRHYLTIHSKNIACKLCKMSKGAKQVSKILDILDLDYSTEVNFDGLRYKQPLYLDFVIWDANDNAILAIEVDGKQHSQEIKFYNEKYSFEEFQERDNIKDKFCEENDLPLLRLEDSDSLANMKLSIENSLNHIQL